MNGGININGINMKFIGVTETYDPSYVPDWENRLHEVNLIISKNLTDEMIDKLVRYKDKIIFHHTVTGLGGTVFEPNVLNIYWSFDQARKLLQSGFPVSQYVFRLDPIVPVNLDTILRLNNILNVWSSLTEDKIRCRVSMLDMYHHVYERLVQSGEYLSYSTFTAPECYFNQISNILSKYLNHFEFEACAETKFDKSVVKGVSCASSKDIEILGKNPDEYGLPAKSQRRVCHCLAKKQILGVKPRRCPNKCIYCY